MDINIFYMVLFFVIGAMIGSFLNVCIVRLPKEQSVITPGSHCFKCGKPVQWYDNIPLLSYWLLRGKCRACGAPFSIRYFFIELLTAGVFLGLYLYYGLVLELLPYLLMICGFIVATFTDFDERIIPDEVSIGGMIAGLLISPLVPQIHHTAVWWQALLYSGLGVLVGGGSIYLMGLLGEFIFKKEAMGGGDVKLMAMVGAFMGWKMALLTFFVAPFFGAVVGIIEKIRTKDSTIAYGPYLVIGALVSLFWGERLIDIIIGGYGFY
ncbi:MAG: prepilin peptidase [Candidatus Omnitrophica bacterium]|nr:prepilin peptidase [Candidatus Omnitrophota bacterium]